MSKLKIPVIPIPNIVFFPKTSLPIYIEGPHYTKMIYDSLRNENDIAISMANSFLNFDEFGQLTSGIQYRPCEVCSLGKPIIMEKSDDNVLKVLFKGIKRIKLNNIVSNFPYPVFDAEDYPDLFEKEFSDQKIVNKISDILIEWIYLHTNSEDEKGSFINELIDLNHIIDYTAMLLIKDKHIRQLILECNSLRERAHMINILLHKNKPTKENALAVKAFKNFEIIDKICSDPH